MKYAKFKDEKQTVTVLQIDAEGHCIETCGNTYVIFSYDDDETKTLVIMDSREFYLEYYPTNSIFDNYGKGRTINKL